MCWRFPGQLFLVNRAYRRDATRIFFSMNHFYDIPHKWMHDDEPKFSPFLQRIPLQGIPHLRSLQFMICSSNNWPPPEWSEGINRLAHSARLSKLQITLDESLLRDISHHLWDDRWAFDEEALARYERLLMPLRRLQGIKDLFVHVAFPLNGSIGQAERQRHAEMEEELERRIMGDGYNSKSRGKFKHKDRFFAPQAHDSSP